MPGDVTKAGVSALQLALASAAFCCWVVTRAWRSLALAIDILSFMAFMFALLAMFIWAMEFVIELRLLSSLRAAVVP